MTSVVPTSETPLAARTRLVIADDSPEMRWLVRATVGDRFDEIVELRDGRELLWELLRASYQRRRGSPPMVVITDLCMPAYDGLDVLGAWAEHEHDVPMIIITAYPSATVHAKARELGAWVLAKPFSTDQLRRVVGEALNRHGA